MRSYDLRSRVTIRATLGHLNAVRSPNAPSLGESILQQFRIIVLDDGADLTITDVPDAAIRVVVIVACLGTGLPVGLFGYVVSLSDQMLDGHLDFAAFQPGGHRFSEAFQQALLAFNSA